jgi:hypothetical protein
MYQFACKNKEDTIILFRETFPQDFGFTSTGWYVNRRSGLDIPSPFKNRNRNRNPYDDTFILEFQSIDNDWDR